MARAATSRKRNIPGFGWLTTKRETYRRDVAGERADRQRAAKYDAAQEKKRLKEQAADQIEIQEQFAFNTGARHREEGKKPHPDQGVLTSPQKFIGVTKTRAIARREYMKGYRQNPECARTVKSKVSDRAKRYRANQPGCKPAGAKQCKLCKSKRFLTVDHVDGNESNGKKSNLRWLCKSCNTRLGSQFAKEGRGRRTVQFNPKGAYNFAEWSQAVAIWNGDIEPSPSMTRERAGEIIHTTSGRRRSEFNEDVWRIRKERYGPSGRKDGGAGGSDMPDWVTNPEASTEYRLGYNIGQMDRQNASMRKTLGELHSAFAANFTASQDWQVFESGYAAGYSGALGHAVPGGDAGGQRCGNPASDFEAGAEAAAMYSRINIRPDRASFLRAFNQWKRAHGKDSSLEKFTAGFRSAAPAHWSGRNPHANWGYGVFAQDTRSAFQSGDQVAFFKTAREAKAFAESHNDELKATGKWYSQAEPHYHVRKALRSAGNPSARRNPDTDSEAGGDNSEEYRQAVKTAELFHGRPVVEHITITENIKEHDWYVRIGPLVSLVVKPLTKKPRPSTKLPFHQAEKTMVHLFVSPDGRQFYLRGGDQELDLEAFGMGPKTRWFRDRMVIGELKEITYEDRKKFHKFKPTQYFHHLGEETKVKPWLMYDAMNKKLEILGGQYHVEMEDLVEDMSPGIVN